MSADPYVERLYPRGGFLSPSDQTQSDQAPAAIETREAFLIFYRANLNRIYSYHLAHTGNAQDAQDLTSITFQAALEHRADYHPGKGSPAAWLMGIARHKLADHFRRASPTFSLDWVEQQPDPSLPLEDRASRRLQIAQVARALKRLAPDRSEALALHFFAGLDLAETARAMGKTPAAVKKLVQRGLADLRQWFAPQMDEGQ